MALLTGQTAETAVANYLADKGFKILDRNWKTAICEIDIVSRKQAVVYFVEVKFRQKPDQGSGFEYILPHKLHQMEFAARIWNQRVGWQGDWRLMAASVDSAMSIELFEL